MDDARFDRLTKALDGPASRRGALRGLAASGVVAGLALRGRAAESKKKKKQKKPCKSPNTLCGKKNRCCAENQSCGGFDGVCIPDECPFSKSPSAWVLQADCTVTGTVQIPRGVTLDGNGKTMSMDSGRTSRLLQNRQSGAFGVRNLTARSVPASMGAGLYTFAPGAATVQDSTFEGFGIGLGFVGGTATIQRTTLRGGVGAADILLSENASATIEDGAFELGTGVGVQTGAEATIEGNDCQGVHAGVNATGGRAVVRDNTMAGPDTPLAIGAFGISYGSGATDEASGNTISKFIDDSASVTSCGIVVDASSGAVTLTDNTFPDPPGNEQNVCDKRT